MKTRRTALRGSKLSQLTSCSNLQVPALPTKVLLQKTHCLGFASLGFARGYIFASKLDEQALGVTWRDWRKTFIEKGGDGLYGSCLPTHLEPIFQTMTWHGHTERAPHFDPRYKGEVKGYAEGDYPGVESFWKRLSCFKTGMQSLDAVEKQVDALGAAIRHYN